MIDILAKIVEYRDARNWSEYQLAEKAGIPQSTINSWYRKNIIPSIASLGKICDALGISVSQLLADENEALVLTADQRVLLEKWTKLSAEQKEALLKLMDTM